jgi:hypothetical protein
LPIQAEINLKLDILAVRIKSHHRNIGYPSYLFSRKQTTTMNHKYKQRPLLLSKKTDGFYHKLLPPYCDMEPWRMKLEFISLSSGVTHPQHATPRVRERRGSRGAGIMRETTIPPTTRLLLTCDTAHTFDETAASS